MNIIKLENVGFCFGVTKSIETATNVLKSNHFPKPVYILGYLIHNKLISKELESLGAIIINESEIENLETGTIITTAHGISDSLRNKLMNSCLTLVDTTCAIVNKTHQIINDYQKQGYTLILLGEKNHKEVIGLTYGKQNIYVIKNIDEIASLPQILEKSKLGFVTQTTVTPYEIETVFETLKAKYPNILQLSSCCDATKKRQIELLSIIEKYKNNPNTLYLVIGDKLSNNTNKLLKTILEKSKCDGLLIENVDELKNLNASKYQNIIITSATSASITIVNEIYDYLLNNWED